jgi:hypothetical protein
LARASTFVESGNLKYHSYSARAPKLRRDVSARYRAGMNTRGPNALSMPTSPGKLSTVPATINQASPSERVSPIEA